MIDSDVLGIATIALSAISIAFAGYVAHQSWRRIVEKAKAKVLLGAFEAGSVCRSLESSMKEHMAEQEKEVVSRIIWRHSQVPLTAVLDNLEERRYLFNALTDPSHFTWDNTRSD